MVTSIDQRVVQLRLASTIEDRAHELHLSIWNNRRDLFGGNVPEDRIALLEPGVALASLGFEVVTDPDLGEMNSAGRRVRVAGLIDHEHKVVRISPVPTYQEQRFTTGHELGHGVLHPGMSGLHRDQVVAGPTLRRDRLESDADKFASSYLMPVRLLLHRFAQCFGCDHFQLDDDTAFGLWGSNSDKARRKFRTQRDLSYFVATATSFMGRPFEALATHFRVSPTAMAIRLEEVGLIDDRSLSKW